MNIGRFSIPRFITAVIALLFSVPAMAEDRPAVLPAKAPTRLVTDETMKRIFEQVKTPFKFGIVIRGEEGSLVDCPSVFRYGGKWYMVYIGMHKIGYETHLATSDNLLHWQTLGKILSFRKTGWDAWQRGGGISLHDHTWGGSGNLHAFDGKYWLSYVGGAGQGYEPDPLAIGIAWTKTPDQPVEWTSIGDAPVLRPDQPDARAFEKVTLYRSNTIFDKERSLGYPFVMVYNAKADCERIGMAVSKDMVHWRRYGPGPVIDNGSGISGDPQVVKVGDVWVMFYFGAFWKPKAFDTFACSYDLVNWTKWTGPHLVEPSEPWDAQYAHKPWVVKHNDVVYHFYCAVGDRGRAIALATSKELKRQ